MLLIICDLINTFCQSVFLVWISNNITAKENKISRSQTKLLIFLVFLDSVLFTYAGIQSPATGLLMQISTLFIAALFYRKFILDALLGFGIGFGILLIISYFLTLFYKNFISTLSLVISPEFQILFFIFIPIWLLYAVIYKFRKRIFNAIIFLKSLKHSFIFVLLLNYVLIFTEILRSTWTTEPLGVTLKSILYFIALIIFLFALFYFAKINDKSKEVEMLNIALSEKITELKKIKHDYGSEISSLYGLYRLGKMDRIGSLLKSIIERNQAVNSTININIQATPLVASVLNSAAAAGINVIVFDSVDYDSLNITDNELLRVLSNIVRNSIDVLKAVKTPMIRFKSYSNYNGITITIINNGPKIPENIRTKIFEVGFSTKYNDNNERGYGLSIVKDILDKCNGKISIDSNEEETEFKIEIPYESSIKRPVLSNTVGGDVLEKIDSNSSFIPS